MKVLIDTNAFAMIQQFNIDLIEKIKEKVPNAELITLKSVIKELENIKDKRAANYALELIKKEKIKTFEEEGKTDDAIIKFAEKNKTIVATNDKELKKRCLEKQIPIIYMREKQKIEIRGI